MTGWQPISTTPKDGTKVDLWFPHTGRATDWEFEMVSPTQGHWIKRHKAHRPTDIAMSTYPNQEPTHWMPLPAPPGGDEQE